MLKSYVWMLQIIFLLATNRPILSDVQALVAMFFFMIRIPLLAVLMAELKLKSLLLVLIL